MSFTKKVCLSQNTDMSETNIIYVGIKTLSNQYCMIDKFYYLIKTCDMSPDLVSMNPDQRKKHLLALGDSVTITIVDAQLNNQCFKPISMLLITLESSISRTIDCPCLEAQIIRKLVGIPINKSQIITFMFDSVIRLIITSIKTTETDTCDNGILTPDTIISFLTIGSKNKITLVNNRDNDINQIPNKIFKTDIKLCDIGIGGLGKEFYEIIRKVFASRIIPKNTLEKLGIKHTKGLLLSGPPGCGKTLLARKIGQMLNCVEPKIVSGPELLSKFVGDSEKNVRDLFKDAIEDTSGEKLYVIILDEIDSLVKSRGTSGDSTGVGDRIVNQFLTMIDGPKELDNILLIGMTNRKDLIDDAILRPGRLEVHIEINLPDEKGRLEILNVHTKKILTNKFLDSSVDLASIASKTKNYTGAEIESLVRNATFLAIARETSFDNTRIDSSKKINPIITTSDFETSMKEMKPMFGKMSDEISIINSREFIFWDQRITQYYNEINSKITNSVTGSKLSFLVHGSHNIGKTKFVAKIIQNLNINCVRVITGDKLLRIGDYKRKYIHNVFNECCKADTSILFFDGLERLIEYTPIGMRFDNSILQTILTIMNCEIESNKKIIIFITANDITLLNQLELDSSIVDWVYAYPDNISRENVKLFGLDSDIYCDQPVTSIFKALKYLTKNE
jgi:vesicle-fusing ATPase